MSQSARDLADEITASLTDPTANECISTEPPHSLAAGAAGIALLHIERAHTQSGSWSTAHRWLTAATAGDLHADHTASLFHDVPALAFVLHAATRGAAGYQAARQTLDAATLALTRARLDAAHARIDRGERPGFREYDLIQGLTGLGAYHLHRQPQHPITTAVLTYLVRLTDPLPQGLPGWWTNHGPYNQPPHEYPGGHGNLGLAHGIAGPLALLALALRQGVVVYHHADAISRICTWLDHWQQRRSNAAWWPQWITLEEAHADVSRWRHPPRASWCYGTPGIARACQLAGIATNDLHRQRMAERALLACLRDQGQVAQITEPGLCHGAAGLLHTSHRMAHDDPSGAIADDVPDLTALLIQRTATTDVPNEFLDGSAGIALALNAVGMGRQPVSAWDRCLLLA
jgi:hypothetical protein